MKLPFIMISLALIVGGLFLALRTNDTPVATPSSTPIEKTAPSSDTTPTPNEPTAFTGTKIVGNYYEYSAADYQAAKAAGRPIFLFFYANWCPTCAAQEPIIKQLMSEIANESKLDDVVAFRVNYNDNATSKDEEKLANEFGVRYQHTMFALDEDGTIVKKFLGQTDASTLRAALTASTE